jgi:hypothetical protein
VTPPHRGSSRLPKGPPRPVATRCRGSDPREVAIHFRGLRPADVSPYWLGDPDPRFWHQSKPMPRLSVFRRHTRCFAEAPQLLSCGCALYRVQPVRPADVAGLARNRSRSATLMEFVSPSTLEPGRVHSTSACHTEYVPSSGFFTLTTASSSPGRPAIFQTGNALGVPLFRGFPPLPGPATRHHGVALLTFAPRRCYLNHNNNRGARNNTIDVTPSLWPPPGPFSSSGSVPPTECYLTNDGRSPPELHCPSRVLPRSRLHPASCVRSCASSPFPTSFLGTSPRADEYLEDCAPANLPGTAVFRSFNRNNPL